MGRLALSLESNAGLANAIMGMEHFKFGLDYYHRYAGLINAINADEIVWASRKYLDKNKMAIVSAGSQASKGNT